MSNNVCGARHNCPYQPNENLVRAYIPFFF